MFLSLVMLVLATALASVSGITVVDDTGAPVAGASVVFTDGAGHTDRQTTAADGIASASAGFVAVRAQVSKRGYLAAASVLPARAPIVLARVLPVIGSVRVATGSPQSLHALPVAAAALDRTAIASSSATTADALLRQLPGFDRQRSNSLFTNYGQLRVSFAGAGTDRGLVLADGIPAQDGFGGQVDWAAYPVSDLARAELLLGAGSALYGAGAAGGVLDLFTYAPVTSPGAQLEGQASLGAGTHEASEQWIDARAPLSQRFAISAALEQQRLSYWDLPPAYASPIDHVATGSAAMASVRARYALSGDAFLEIAQRSAWDAQDEGRANYTFSRRFNQTVLRYARSGAASLLAAGVFARTGFVFNSADQYPTAPGELRYTQNVPANETGAYASWISGPQNAQIDLRADARHVRGESDQFGTTGAFSNSGSGSQNLYGFAVQQTLRSRRFEFVWGARLDGVSSYDLQMVSTVPAPAVRTPPSRTDSAVSPRVALRYSASKHLALRVSEGSGLRAPFLNELVRGYFIGSTSFLPNPGLVPERSHTLSFGADVIDDAHRFSLDGFDTVVNDAIIFETVDPTHEERMNVGQTRTGGYTASYTQSLGRCARLTASGTSQYARVTGGPAALIGKQLAYVPSAEGNLAYDATIGAIGAGLTLSYMGPAFADDLNTQPLGTALVLGARVRIPAGGAWLDLSASNAAGTRYLSSIDRYGPPAVVSLALRLPIGKEKGATDRCP